MSAFSHIVVDWGTSSLRLWVLDRDGNVLAERRSSEGLDIAAAQSFEAVLEAHLDTLDVPQGVPVMMCGMVGSRAGWVEAPYLHAPVRLEDLVARATHVPACYRPVWILPGIAQVSATAPDVLRGEETQLLTLAHARHNGLACLPGTHSKWVHLVDGAVQGFVTFMTGELFQLLRTASVIRPAVEGAETVDPESAGFHAGVTAALDEPARMTHLLFELRAGWLLAGTAPSETLARLSGLLIGVELAGAMSRHGSLDGAVLMAATSAAPLYKSALAIAGVADVTTRDAETCVREGLHTAATAAFLHPQESLS